MTTHFSPTPNASGPTRYRISVCGYETEAGNLQRAGSSNLAHVTCKECRRIAKEQGLRSRAASVKASVDLSAFPRGTCVIEAESDSQIPFSICLGSDVLGSGDTLQEALDEALNAVRGRL